MKHSVVTCKTPISASLRHLVQLMTEVKAQVEEVKALALSNSQMLLSVQSAGYPQFEWFEMPRDLTVPVQTMLHLDQLETRILDDKDLENQLVNT